MATTAGTVEEIYVENEFAFIKLKKTTGSTATFFLWSVYINENYSSFERILQGYWMGLLRDALANRLSTEIGYASGSTVISSVSIVPAS